MISTIRLSWVSGVLGYRALFAWNSPGLFLTSLVLTPLLQLAFFVILGASVNYESPAFFIVGNAIQVAAAAGISGMVSVIADERRFGTLSLVLGSPASKVAVFVGRILPGVLLGIGVSLFASLVGFIATGWPIRGSDLLFFGLAIVLASFSSATFGLFLSALGLVYRDIFQIAGAAYLLMLVVSGANVSRDRLAPFFRWVGDVLPQTHSIDAARILAGTQDGSLAPTLWLEAVVGVGWLTASLVGMKAMESLARKRSTIDLY